MPQSNHARAQQAYEAFLRTRSFGSLDGLRCFAILAVIWHHSGHQQGALARGEQGVALFFAISGFLITTLLLRERDTIGLISLSRFYARRALRIFPLYYAVLALYVLLVAVLERHSQQGRDFFSNLPTFLTYTSNWFLPNNPKERVVFHFAWSLATEEQFYLVWPWIVTFGGMLLGPVASALALLAIRQAVGLGLEVGMLTSAPLPVRILYSIQTPILLGCLAAYALHRPTSFRLLWQVLGRRFSVLGSLLLLAVALPMRQSLLSDDLLALGWAGLVVTCCIREDHGIQSLLSNRALRHVGVVSYGMYLLHMLVMNTTRRLAGDAGALPTFVTASALTIAAATVCYYGFERPILRYKERFSPFEGRGSAA